jgi:hypothetical protein
LPENKQNEEQRQSKQKQSKNGVKRTNQTTSERGSGSRRRTSKTTKTHCCQPDRKTRDSNQPPRRRSNTNKHAPSLNGGEPEGRRRWTFNSHQRVGHRKKPDETMPEKTKLVVRGQISSQNLYYIICKILHKFNTLLRLTKIIYFDQHGKEKNKLYGDNGCLNTKLTNQVCVVSCFMMLINMAKMLKKTKVIIENRTPAPLDYNSALDH